MPFTPRDWTDGTAPALSAANIEDLETRTTDYTDLVAGSQMGVYNVVAYGADPTGASYSDAAFADAMDAIRALQDDTYPAEPGAILWIPWGSYKLSETLLVDRCMIIQGVSGPGSNSGTMITWDEEVTGIRVINYVDGSGAPYYSSGDYSIIRDLMLASWGDQGQWPALGTGDGINISGHGVRVQNVKLKYFTRNGIRIQAGTPRNANNWYLDNVVIEQCAGDGLYVQGNDTSAGTGMHIDATYNGGWGIHDQSFLGNSYVGCHTSGNGYVTGITGSHRVAIQTTLSGTIGEGDMAIPVTDASTFPTEGVAKIQGGTLTAEDFYFSAKVGGTALTVYRRGHGSSPANWGTAYGGTATTVTMTFGGAHVPYSAASNWTKFIGCYTEGGQGCLDFGGHWIGPLGTDPSGAGRTSAKGEGSPSTHFIGWPYSDDAIIQIGIGDYTARAFSLKHGNYDPDQSLFRLAAWNDGTPGVDPGRWSFEDDHGFHMSFYHSDRFVRFHEGFKLGNASPQRYVGGGAAPVSGAWVVGDMVFNQTPTPGGYAGWICTTAGTPGTWKTFGSISA